MFMNVAFLKRFICFLLVELFAAVGELRSKFSDPPFFSGEREAVTM
jgi:hypothetical protein